VHHNPGHRDQDGSEGPPGTRWDGISWHASVIRREKSGKFFQRNKKKKGRNTPFKKVIAMGGRGAGIAGKGGKTLPFLGGGKDRKIL
jgi:hypothetical protein